MPRSLHFAYRNIVENLNFLATDYGSSHVCHGSAERTLATLNNTTIEPIFDQGLHEFLTDFIECNNRLGAEIADVYNFE